jgi:hypothetical protein
VAAPGIAVAGPSTSAALASSASAAAWAIRPRWKTVQARKREMVAAAGEFPRRRADSRAIVSAISAVASESAQSRLQQAA